MKKIGFFSAKTFGLFNKKVVVETIERGLDSLLSKEVYRGPSESYYVLKHARDLRVELRVTDLEIKITIYRYDRDQPIDHTYYGEHSVELSTMKKTMNGTLRKEISAYLDKLVLLIKMGALPETYDGFGFK